MSHSGFLFSLWTLDNKESIIAGERGERERERRKGERKRKGKREEGRERDGKKKNKREAGDSNYLEWMEQEREI